MTRHAPRFVPCVSPASETTRPTLPQTVDGLSGIPADSLAIAPAQPSPCGHESD